ncbi:hypothetical protein DL93DRAFT_2078204 [Clavulina sp. PMI_390]|nr:hypothetical protein DL93DRAFT_2078204 [Clavulina sp. PMI_390]
MSDTLREDLQRRSEALYSTTPIPNINLMAFRSLPEEVHKYHSLVPLEGTDKERRTSFMGCTSLVYRAVNKETGDIVTLRRIEGFRLTNETAFAPVDKWNSLRHPNIAHLREAFTTRAFGDYSLVFVYDYYPSAQTLYSTHLAPPDPSVLAALHSAHAHSQSSPQSSRQRHYRKNNNGRGAGSSSSLNLPGNGLGVGEPAGPIEEKTLWSYVVQIVSAMKEAHDKGLALRVLDATKVLVVGKNRIRINCCGVFDVLGYEHRLSVEAQKYEDVQALARLIVALCTRGQLNIATQAQQTKDAITRTYSPDVWELIFFLAQPQQRPLTVDKILERLGNRVLMEMNAAQGYSDQLEGELMGELENGRLVRLMSKLGFINERPDFSHEPRWSETGDRYIIGLFRDYVFHQVDETGNPVVNLTHVITCLNKLDAGIDEKIMLVSRDEQTCFVVSYKELKLCIDSAFGELARRR